MGDMRGFARRNPLVTAVLALIALWILLSIIGLLIRGLFYLFVIGVILFVLTLAWGSFTAGRRSRR